MRSTPRQATERPLVVAVDPEGCAWQVVEEAASLASDLGAPVVLMTVVALPAGVSASTPMAGVEYGGRTAEQVLVDDARAALEGLATVLRARDVSVTTEVREGDCVPQVLAAAEAHDARLMVLGTHGRRGLQRLFLGSVAEQLIRRAAVPVLTVRAEGDAYHPSADKAAVRALADG